MSEIRRSFIKLGLLFAISGIITALMYCYDCESPERIAWTFLFGGSVFAAVWKSNELAVNISDSYFDWLEEPFKRFSLNLLLIVILTIITYLGISFFFNVFFWDDSPQEFVEELVWADFYIPVMVSFVINLFMYGKSFLYRWREEYVKVEQLKTEQISMQFESLKNQVNPHFLFNSLNALSSLVYEDQDSAVSFIRKLSDVYRYVLDSREKEVVPLADEIKFTRSFIFLQQIRFGDNLLVDVEDFETEDRVVPPLSIQLLVENSIKHNVVSEHSPLRITITREGEYLVISNGKKEKRIKDSTGIGLNNLRGRYRYLTEKPVLIDSNKDFFTVRTPLLKMKE